MNLAEVEEPRKNMSTATVEEEDPKKNISVAEIEDPKKDLGAEVEDPNKKDTRKLNIITKRPYLFYIGTSVAYGALIMILALAVYPDGWADFLTTKPARGDMGYGRFIIRGARLVEGVYTPFAYPWRTLEPSKAGQILAWIAYCIHQLGQWIILARVHFTKKEIVKWSDDYQWWNWQMVYLNVAMLAFKLIHGQVFYDGLALDVPEGIAQGSVVLILVIAIIIAIPFRGLIFGFGKIKVTNTLIAFIRRYHGYAISFGTVFNFHYHPTEGTMAHLFGFIYQCLLIWQSTNFLHNSHRNKNWRLLLETWVFIHGTTTAVIQPGTGWQIFSYGFMLVFLLNQIFQTPLGKNYWILGALYAAFIGMAYWGFRENNAYYRALFIPLAEYVCVFIILGVGYIGLFATNRLPEVLKLGFVIFMYLFLTILLTVGLALVLSQNLKVYNDY